MNSTPRRTVFVSTYAFSARGIQVLGSWSPMPIHFVRLLLNIFNTIVTAFPLHTKCVSAHVHRADSTRQQ